MALTILITQAPGGTIKSADWNGEFNNIYNNSLTLISPLTGNLDCNSKTLTNLPTITNTGTLTLPTSTDTLVGRATTDTLTNKTLTSPVISTITNTGTITLPTSTDTLVGRATTDTLTNKTLTTPTIASIVNTGTLTLPTSTDTLVGRATTDTLTNKTLTAPVLSGTATGTYTLGGTPTISSPTITTPTISATGWTNANHAHTGASSGGTVSATVTNSTADVTTSETTTSTSYTNLTTSGPAITLSPGSTLTHAIFAKCEAAQNTSGEDARMSVAIAGVAAVNADGGNVSAEGAANVLQHIHTHIFAATQTSGATHTMKYKVSAGTGTFVNRRISGFSFGG